LMLTLGLVIRNHNISFVFDIFIHLSSLTYWDVISCNC
jgi:hypothetical protein